MWRPWPDLGYCTTKLNERKISSIEGDKHLQLAYATTVFDEYEKKIK
jgi:hypothetical protein